MYTKDRADEIEERLATLCHQLTIGAASNRHDLHLACEDFYCRVLNMAYGYKLENANASGFNNPGNDLVDDEARLLVQVTAENSRAKIEATLQGMPAGYSGYSMKFLMLVSKKRRFREKPVANPAGLAFDLQADVMDIGDLMRRIRTLAPEDMEPLHALVMRELRPDMQNAPGLDSELSEVVGILSAESLLEISDPTNVEAFKIDEKVAVNSLEGRRKTILGAAVRSHKLERIYAEWDKAGTDTASVVLYNLSKCYERLRGDAADADSLYDAIVRDRLDLVKSSPNCPDTTSGRLEMCVDIVVADAFLRCRIFEGPNVLDDGGEAGESRTGGAATGHARSACPAPRGEVLGDAAFE